MAENTMTENTMTDNTMTEDTMTDNTSTLNFVPDFDDDDEEDDDDGTMADLELEETPELRIAFEKFQKHEAWAESICNTYGIRAAISFAVGSDIVLDYIIGALSELAYRPRGTHVGELSDEFSVALASLLPKQFLMKYDYDFIYLLKTTVETLRTFAACGREIVAHTVMEELAIYMFAEAACAYREEQELLEEMGADDDYSEDWNGLSFDSIWAFDILGDMDIVTALYSGIYMEPGWTYHFDNWRKIQFYTDSAPVAIDVATL